MVRIIALAFLFLIVVVAKAQEPPLVETSIKLSGVKVGMTPEIAKIAFPKLNVNEKCKWKEKRLKYCLSAKTNIHNVPGEMTAKVSSATGKIYQVQINILHPMQSMALCQKKAQEISSYLVRELGKPVFKNILGQKSLPVWEFGDNSTLTWMPLCINTGIASYVLSVI